MAEEEEEAIDRAIIAGYERIPPEPDSWHEVAARLLIAEEPW